MIDASSEPYETNVAICQKVCEAEHAVNVSVEGELGTIGNTDSVETTVPDEILYTDPAQAKDFIEKTGVVLPGRSADNSGIFPHVVLQCSSGVRIRANDIDFVTPRENRILISRDVDSLNMPVLASCLTLRR